MSAKVLTIKKVKISSKGQLIFTLPQEFLDKIETKKGDDMVVEFLENEIRIFNQKQRFREKLKKFKPISLGTDKKVDFSQTHNDIYD
jgi:bifunctional DNA-binding transcriptional regulator/antitoxin component of YhaV-PrlF toxin-antitoxin module